MLVLLSKRLAHSTLKLRPTSLMGLNDAASQKRTVEPSVVVMYGPSVETYMSITVCGSSRRQSSMQRVLETCTKVCSARLGVVPTGHPEKRKHSDCFAVQNVLFDWDIQTSAYTVNAV